MELTQRQRQIIRRMCQRERFYSKLSPRMSKREAVELDRAGFFIQWESVEHADTSDGFEFYPFRLEEFRAKAREAGIIE